MTRWLVSVRLTISETPVVEVLTYLSSFRSQYLNQRSTRLIVRHRRLRRITSNATQILRSNVQVRREGDERSIHILKCRSRYFTPILMDTVPWRFLQLILIQTFLESLHRSCIIHGSLQYILRQQKSKIIQSNDEII